MTVCEWTDRIYQNTQPEHIITNVVSGRKMRVQKYNFPDTVVWNPWQEKARDIPDFGDDEFPNMICVESGHVSSPVILLPGTAFEASQILQVKAYIRPSRCEACDRRIAAKLNRSTETPTVNIVSQFRRISTAAIRRERANALCACN